MIRSRRGSEEESTWRIAAAIRAQSAASRSICPSQVARTLAQDEVAWRALLPVVREVAAAMVEAGVLEVTQGGEVVDPRNARGPIRLRRPGGRGLG